MTTRILFALALLLWAIPAVGEEEAAAPPSPCGQPEASQFDFWLGTWDVEANGQVVGRNVIEKAHGGCTLTENYHATGGAFEGQSFNYFDPGDASWHQVWVDNAGTRLHLKGGYADRKMVMSGERVTPKGPVTDRISWTDNPDGTVRQLWELSPDGGETWQVLFDGLYRQAAAGSQGEGE
jgi:hypothetical protein